MSDIESQQPEELSGPLTPLDIDNIPDIATDIASPPDKGLIDKLVPKVFHRAAEGISQAFDDIEQRRTGWQKKAAVFAVAGLAQVISVAGIGVLSAKAISRSDSGSKFEHTAKPHVSNLEAAPDIGILEKKLYEESGVVEQDYPFAPTFLTAQQRVDLAGPDKWQVLGDDEVYSNLNDEKTEPRIQDRLDAYEARFMTAVRLSSGIRVNMYRSDLDSSTEPLSFDPKALDVMVTRLIDMAQDIEGSPVNDEMAKIRQKAAHGALKLRLSMVVLSDEKLCLNKKFQFIEQPYSNRCAATGVNLRKLGPATNNQLIATVDSGPYGARNYYPKSDDQPVLPPDQTFGVIAGHEIAHALFGSTAKNGSLTIAEEHRRFVFPTEAKMYRLFCNLNKNSADSQTTSGNSARYITPLHLDTTDTSARTAAPGQISEKAMDKVFEREAEKANQNG